jgi:hypothetical protein
MNCEILRRFSDQQSGGRDDLVFVAGRAGCAGTAARTARLFRFGFVGVAPADGRRQNVEWNGLAAVPAVGFGSSLFALGLLVATRAPLAVEPLAPVRTLVATRFVPFRALVAGFIGFGLSLGELLVALVFAFVALVAARALVFEARTVFAEHSEIVIRELQIIFGLDSVARELGVARHALVFLEQLRGIAALAIVLSITGLSADIPASALSPATAPAAALTIIDQMPTSLSSGS